MSSAWRTAVIVLVVISASVMSVLLQAQGSNAQARTVWDGVYTAEQAQRGRNFYAEHCARCHGGDLQGGEHRALTGDRFWASWQDTMLERLFRHVATNMPHSEDGSLKGTLSPSVYADIIAYILSRNEFPAGSTPLTEASIVGVRVVRKGGSGELPAGSYAHVVGCLAPRGADRNWKLVRASRPSRVLEGETPDVKAPLGDREYTLMFVMTSLDKFVGHRMSVRASLIGEGGAQGLNVTTVTSVSETCQ
jgi:mono/diheme cytochrome c family protein